MSRFVIGDIHGAHRALIQCLDRSGIEKEDQLFCLGDVADGWPDVPRCFEVLYGYNVIYIMGNHDMWMAEYLDKPDLYHPEIWTSQGGSVTVKAYEGRDEWMKRDLHFLRNRAKEHYLTDDNILFVHGGYNSWLDEPLKDALYNKAWNRDLLQKATEGYSMKKLQLDKFTAVYIGHTSVNSLMRHYPKAGIKKDTPFRVHNLWNLDTGAGWEGKLTIMNVDTGQYWQSDNIKFLYPEVEGRS